MRKIYIYWRFMRFWGNRHLLAERSLFLAHWTAIIIGLASLAAIGVTLRTVRNSLNDQIAVMEKNETVRKQEWQKKVEEQSQSKARNEKEFKEEKERMRKKDMEVRLEEVLKKALDLNAELSMIETKQRILSLEKFYRELPDEHSRINDVLVSFIQRRASKKAGSKNAQDLLTPPEDVQMALSVLCKRPSTDKEEKPLNLSQLILKGANFEDAVLNKANLSGTDLRNCNLRKTKLERANLTGADLTEAHMEEAQLEWAILEKAILKKAHMTKANLSSASLGEANADRADLTGVNFKEAKAGAAFFRRATLAGSNIDSAYLQRAHLEGADMSNLVSAENADLSWARLEKANLTQANFEKAILRGAVLTGAIAKGVRVQKADLANSQWTGVNLKEAKGMSDRQLKSLKSYDADKIPEGLK